MSQGKYVCTIVRKDIPLADQVVQACHSSLQAGAEFLTPNLIPSLILLEARDAGHLQEIQSLLDKKAIKHHRFFEPDEAMGYTSITTEPLDHERKKALSNLRLWRV